MCNGRTRDLVPLATMGWLHECFVQHGNQSCEDESSASNTTHSCFLMDLTCMDDHVMIHICVYEKYPRYINRTSFFLTEALLTVLMYYD